MCGGGGYSWQQSWESLWVGGAGMLCMCLLRGAGVLCVWGGGPECYVCGGGGECAMCVGGGGGCAVWVDGGGRGLCMWVGGGGRVCRTRLGHVVQCAVWQRAVFGYQCITGSLYWAAL